MVAERLVPDHGQMEQLPQEVQNGVHDVAKPLG